MEFWELFGFGDYDFLLRGIIWRLQKKFPDKLTVNSAEQFDGQGDEKATKRLSCSMTTALITVGRPVAA